MSGEKTSDKKLQADIEFVGFASGTDASQFGGHLQQVLINAELSGGNNSVENTTGLNQLQKGTTEALNNLQKKIQVTAFESGSIPPAKDAGGIVMQGVASYTLTSSSQPQPSSYLLNSNSSQMPTTTAQQAYPPEHVSTAPPQVTFEVVGKDSILINSPITSYQAHTMIHQAYVLPKESLPETWNLPRGTTHFIGRQELLENIEACFSKENASQHLVLTACHGLGGVGKTQLALHYAWENYQKYKGVCFFSAASKEELINSYVDLGNELNIFTLDQKSLLPQKRALIVKNWLEDPKRAGWLLIYDNASKYEDISALLPAKGGKILMTSRHIIWPGETIPVDVFTLEEAREYVKKITGITNEPENTDELIKTLGRLPLALAQACAYIKRAKKSIRGYLGLYQKSRADLLEKKILPEGDNHEPVAVTWKITLEAMKEEAKESVELMYFCSQLHHENIPVGLLNHFFTEEIKADDAKRVAEEYSMIKMDEVKKTLSIHSVVQEVIKIQLQKEKKLVEYLRKSAKILIQIYPGVDDRAEAFQQKINLLAHLNSILNNMDENTKELNKVKDKKKLELIIEDLSDAYDDLGNAQKSKVLLERALTIQEEDYGKNHVKVASTLNNLGNVYRTLGDAKKSKELLERALSIVEKHYGKEHVQVASTLNNLGNAYGALGDAQKKKALLERALIIEEKHCYKDHIQVAITLTNLGDVCGDLGDAKKSKELLERALPIVEKHYGKEHVQVASTLNNLGNAYGALGDEEKKKALLERVLIIDEKHYGKGHVKVASTLNNLGAAYRSLGEEQKSKELFERALIIGEKYYGKDHYQVVDPLVNLGKVYVALGDVQKSKEFFERALIIAEKHYGENHYQVAGILVDLGKVYDALGDAKKSKELLESALPIFEKHYGKEHVQVAITLINLGNAYGALGDAQKQKALLERALIIEEKHYGKNHVEVAITLGNLGNAYSNLGDAQKQKELLERALIIGEKHYGKDHYQVAITLTNLGTAHGSLGDAQKSKVLLERALSIFSKKYGVQHPHVEVVKRKLILLNFLEERQMQIALALSLAESNQQKAIDNNLQPSILENLENDPELKMAKELSIELNRSPVNISSFFVGYNENQCGQKILEFLTNKGDVNATDANGNNLLILASGSKGYPSVVKLLLDKGVNIHHTNNKGESALHIAVGRQAVSDDFLIVQKQAKIKVLLERGANPNLIDKEGNTPLSLAVKHKYSGIVELLSKSERNVMSAEKPGGPKT